MSEDPSREKSPASHIRQAIQGSGSGLRERIDVLIRVAFGALIIAGCFFTIQPFLTSIVLSAILTVVTWPMYDRVCEYTGDRRTISASIMVTVIIVTVLVPLTFLCAFLAQQIPNLVVWIRDWVEAGMPIPGWIGSIPYLGPYITSNVDLGIDSAALTGFFRKAIDPATKWILSFSVNIGYGLFQVALVALISFFFYRDGVAIANLVRRSVNMVSGDLADEFNSILVNTTRSVVFGVIGTAVGQGIVASVGFYLAGVPGVFMLSFLVFMLSVVPVGPPLVWGPAALWLFATGQTGWAIFLALWGLLAVSSVDNFLKPLLISRGSTLPLGLVFLGVFGGIISFGFLGLVLGPILLSAGLAMVRVWLKNPRRPRSSMADTADGGQAADAGEEAKPAAE